MADEQRANPLPDVPTFAEAGLPGMQAVTWFAIVAPPGTPAAAIAGVQKSVADALASADIKQKFADQGAEPRGWSPTQTGRFINSESQKWNKVIKSANGDARLMPERNKGSTMQEHTIHWKGPGLTRVPFDLYSNGDVAADEQARIFRGEVWNYPLPGSRIAARRQLPHHLCR